VKACRNRNRRRRNSSDGALGRSLAESLEHGLRYLLNEQRYAVCALNNVFPDTRWQRLISGDAVDHGHDFALPEPVKSECCDMGSSNPGRVEFRSVRNNQQRTKGSYPVNHATKCF